MWTEDHQLSRNLHRQIGAAETFSNFRILSLSNVRQPLLGCLYRLLPVSHSNNPTYVHLSVLFLSRTLTNTRGKGAMVSAPALPCCGLQSTPYLPRLSLYLDFCPPHFPFPAGQYRCLDCRLPAPSCPTGTFLLPDFWLVRGRKARRLLLNSGKGSHALVCVEPQSVSDDRLGAFGSYRHRCFSCIGADDRVVLETGILTQLLRSRVTLDMWPHLSEPRPCLTSNRYYRVPALS